MKTILLVISFSILCTSALAFDVEDYATTYRATRDNYRNKAIQFEVSYNTLIIKERILKSSCYKIVGADYAHLQGLRSGTCAKDGEKADQYGGVYGGGTKLGTRIKDLLLSTPAWANFPDVITKSNLAYTLNDGLVSSAPGSAALTITLDASCTPTDDYMAGADSTQIAAIIDEYKAAYDVFLIQANQLNAATAPFKAATESYKATSTVYTMSIGCDSQVGNRDPDLFDPYVP